MYTDNTHALIVVRLKGNASIETEGAASVLVQKLAAEADFQNATVTVTGAPVLLKQINDYLKGGMLTLGGHRRRRHDASSCCCCSTCVGGCCPWA